MPKSGHSAGGLISMTTKAGTNELHGTGFYLGRYPWLSAEADRTTNSLNAQRQNMFGGTLGNPIMKNKLFNFASMEYWKVGYPEQLCAHRADRARSKPAISRSPTTSMAHCAPSTIPTTTKLNPATGAVTAQPFPGNKIPASRFDPLAGILMKQFWAPNNPGDNITGVNNFRKGFIENYDYYNFSDRVDYNINDKWKVFGRVGPLQHHRSRRQSHAANNFANCTSPPAPREAPWQHRRRCRLDRQPAHRRGVPWRLAQT